MLVDRMLLAAMEDEDDEILDNLEYPGLPAGVDVESFDAWTVALARDAFHVIACRRHVRPDALLEILHDLQEELGAIPESSLPVLAKALSTWDAILLVQRHDLLLGRERSVADVVHLARERIRRAHGAALGRRQKPDPVEEVGRPTSCDPLTVAVCARQILHSGPRQAEQG